MVRALDNFQQLLNSHGHSSWSMCKPLYVAYEFDINWYNFNVVPHSSANI